MATLKSEQYTTQTGATTGHLNTETHCITRYAKYTLLGTESTGDIIQMFDLPAGSFVTSAVMQWEDLGSGTTIGLELGDGGDDDRFIETVSGLVVGQAVMDGAGSQAFSAAADTVDITLTLSGATLTAGAVIRVFVTATRTSDSDQ